MEILKTLQDHGSDLYPEDLDFFETELATGEGYNAAYQAQCMSLIKKLRTWMDGGDDSSGDKRQPSKNQTDKKASGSVEVRLSDLAPREANPVVSSLSPEEILRRDIVSMREATGYKTQFKSFVKKHAEIDADYIEAHFSWFLPWELGAIISVRQMPEEFLEKYFGALDHDKIARYQQFSESFFMKHFSQMDASIVLEHGKNEWRKKENRSKQLDVFLRLKGFR